MRARYCPLVCSPLVLTGRDLLGARRPGLPPPPQPQPLLLPQRLWHSCTIPCGLHPQTMCERRRRRRRQRLSRSRRSPCGNPSDAQRWEERRTHLARARLLLGLGIALRLGLGLGL